MNIFLETRFEIYKLRLPQGYSLPKTEVLFCINIAGIQK